MLKELWQHPLGICGGLAVVILLLVALLAPYIAPYDPLAINDIPLKLVLHQLDETTTQLSFKNPVHSLQDYGLKPEMAAELLERVQGILSF